MIVSVWFWVAVAALGAGTLLAALFHSMREFKRGELEDLASASGRAATRRRIERILGDVDGHSTAIGLPRVVCNLIVAVALVFWTAGVRRHSAPDAWDVVIGIVVATVLIWMFGVLVPHSVARYAAARTVYAWSPALRAAYIVQAPLRAVVVFFDEVIRRLSGAPAGDEGPASEAELLSAIQEAQHEGQVDDTERRMIEAVVGFRDRTVEQIMTPRTEIVALELTNNLGELTRFIRSCSQSRVPVYEGDLDHIAGIFYIKDLVRWLAGDSSRPPGKPFELRSILRPALFVPETKTVRELLSELIARKVHVAMVADEYGGTSGLVTMEDIVEEVFGDIQDEYELDQDRIPDTLVDERARSARIDGRAYIADTNEALAVLGIELPASEEYDTVGGLVVTTLGRIPAVGETVELGPVTLRVVEAGPTRVEKVTLTVARPAPLSPDAESSPGSAPVVTTRRDETRVGP